MSRVRRLRRAIRHCSEGLDVNGSAISLGQSVGASGARLMTTHLQTVHVRYTSYGPHMMSAEAARRAGRRERRRSDA
jgi:acetyl-CoA acetyltransferase